MRRSIASSQTGNISKPTPDSVGRQVAVRLEQGRPILDSDWNAQADLWLRRHAATAVDWVGTGGPADGAGFAISPIAHLDFDGVGSVLVLPACKGPGPGLLFRIEIGLASTAQGVLLATVLGEETAEDNRSGFVLTINAERYPVLQWWEEDVEIVIDENGLVVSDQTEVYTLIGDQPLPEQGLARLEIIGECSTVTLCIDGTPCGTMLNDSEFDLCKQLSIGAAVVINEPLSPCRCAITGLRLSAWYADRSGEGGREHVPVVELGEWNLNDGFGPEAADASEICRTAKLRGLGDGEPPRWVVEDLTISSGRYYLDGHLLEFDHNTSYLNQSEFPGAVWPKESGSAGDDPEYLAVLSGWLRDVGGLNDPDLGEPALALPEASRRTVLTAQVRLIPKKHQHTPEFRLCSQSEPGAMVARRRAESQRTLGNTVYRVESHTGGGLLGDPRGRVSPELYVREQTDELKFQCELIENSVVLVGDTLELYEAEAGFDSDAAPVLATVRNISVDGTTIEFEDVRSGDLSACMLGRRIATFKWSRDNASEQVRIESMDETRQTLTMRRDSPVPNELLPGDYIEVSDTRAVLLRRTPCISRVAEVFEGGRTVRLAEPIPPGLADDPSRHPILTRWQQTKEEDAPGNGVLLARADEWVRLEAGIEVRFEGDLYCRGDYWQITAREDTQQIRWPDKNGQPTPIPAVRAWLGECALAELVFKGRAVSIKDCRKTFASLTDQDHDIVGDVRISGNVEIDGDVRSTQILGHLAPDTVGPEQIRADVGVLPRHACILTTDPHPTPGFCATGDQAYFSRPGMSWEEAPEKPDFGRVRHMVANDFAMILISEEGRVFALFAPDVRWTELGDLPHKRKGTAVGLVGSSVLVAGGMDENNRPMKRLDILNLETNNWAQGPDMRVARSHATATGVRDELHVFGGKRRWWVFSFWSRLSERYSLSESSWLQRPKTPAARMHAAACTAGDEAVVLGGRERRWLIFHPTVCRVNTISIHSQRWERLPGMRHSRHSFGAGCAGDRIFAIGNHHRFQSSRQTETISIDGYRWLCWPDLPAPALAAAVFRGRLFALTGTPSHTDDETLWSLKNADEYFVHGWLGSAPTDPFDTDA